MKKGKANESVGEEVLGKGRKMSSRLRIVKGGTQEKGSNNVCRFRR